MPRAVYYAANACVTNKQVSHCLDSLMRSQRLNTINPSTLTHVAKADGVLSAPNAQYLSTHVADYFRLNQADVAYDHDHRLAWNNETLVLPYLLLSAFSRLR